MIAEAQTAALELPFALEMIGLIVGTVGGTLAACQRKLDILGGVGLGMVCGLGGGLLRDTIMQVGSVYMLDSPYAIPVAIASSLLVFFFRSPFERHPETLEWIDILGVGLFAAAGADKAIVYGLTPMAVLLMGVLTGNGGGLLRDIVLGDVPKIFQKGNWYAICALGGSVAYLAGVEFLGVEKGLAGTVCVALTVALRRAALRYNLQSPADVDLTPKVEDGFKRLRHRRARSQSRSRKSH